MVGFSVRGDFGKLAHMVSGMKALAAAKWKPPTIVAIAEETRQLVGECFERSKDPYGNNWPKLRSRAGKPLQDTGRLQASIAVRPGATGFTIGTNVLYAATHNFGATIRAKNAPYLRFRVGGRNGPFVSVKQVTIPRRQFLPERSFPRPWLTRYRSVVAKQMKQVARQMGAR